MKDIVFDIETEKSFDEVGGKGNFHLLGITVVGVYDYDTDKYIAYEKEELGEFAKLLQERDRVIGFNIKHFDIPVLAPHMDFNIYSMQVLDLMDDVERSAGFRISLDNLAQNTLDAAKSGHGLDAIKWWREGEKQKVKDYCIQDVRLTRDLYEYGKENGEVMFESRQLRTRTPLKVSWGVEVIEVPNVIRSALDKRRSVKISCMEGGGFKKHENVYTVDVWEIRQSSFVGFCHENKLTKVFSFDDVENVEILENEYKLQQDVQQSLI